MTGKIANDPGRPATSDREQSRTYEAHSSGVLHELLGALGDGRISLDQFWRHMGQHGLGDREIDGYCAVHGGYEAE
jgi:hypothetical protein